MAQTRSLPVGRREAILERVNARGEARVADLASELGVSAITVRRDIASLDGEGLPTAWCRATSRLSGPTASLPREAARR